MYGAKNIAKTFFSYKGNSIRFKCDTLIGNLITNYNSYFLISVVEYSKLILIDDGIGTPVILENPNYYSSPFKYKIKNLFLKITSFLILGLKFKLYDDYYDDIKYYYTVYDFKNQIKSEKINIFHKSNKVLVGSKCFIGQPILEFGQISQQAYISFLKKVVKKEGQITYYAHPQEKILENLQLDGLTYIKSKLTIEKNFELNGIPEHVISFYSSSLLNLKMCNPEIRFYYVLNDFSITSKSVFKTYQDLLDRSGIMQYQIPIT